MTHRRRRDPTTATRHAWVIDRWPAGQASTIRLLRRCGIIAEAAAEDAGRAPADTDILVVADAVTPELKANLTRYRGPRCRIIVLSTREHRSDIRRDLGPIADHVATRPLTHGLVRRVLGADVPTAARPRPASTRPVADSSKRVLIVEDNSVNQMLAQRFVEAAGFDTGVASSGVEALSQVAEHHFDVILMDCRMPGMDGWQTTRAIREREAGSGRRIPIIAMTADAQEGAKDRCINAGMDEYLPKPVDPDLLASMLRNLTGSSTG